MLWAMKQLFCVKKYYEIKSFKIYSSKIQNKVQFQHISKQESDFQVG